MKTQKFILLGIASLSVSGAFADEYEHQYYLKRGYIQPTRAEKIDRIYDYIDQVERIQQSEARAEALSALSQLSESDLARMTLAKLSAEMLADGVNVNSSADMQRWFNRQPKEKRALLMNAVRECQRILK